ncbi:hypothetical protein SprV_0702302600 [Sparganum proliferum]
MPSVYSKHGPHLTIRKETALWSARIERYTTSCSLFLMTAMSTTGTYTCPSVSAYRGSVHSSTGFTPHCPWTGRDIRLPIDLNPFSRPDATTPNDYATRLREIIRSAHNAARTIKGTSKPTFIRRYTSSRRPCHVSQPFTPTRNVRQVSLPLPRSLRRLRHPSPTTLLIRDAIYPNARPFTAHFDKFKPHRGRLPICSPNSLPIRPADQVPPVAIEVTVP